MQSECLDRKPTYRDFSWCIIENNLATKYSRLINWCQQILFRICGYKVCHIIIIGSYREFKIISKLLNANYVQILHIIYVSKFKHNSNTWINFLRFKKSTHHYAGSKYFVCSHSDQNNINVVRPRGNKILL